MFARRRDLLEREAERIGALAVQGDVTIPQHLERLVQATVGAFGGIDVLVLNGGGPPAGPATGMTAESVEEAVALLLTSHVSLVGHCLPHLRASGRGRIIAIESSSVREPLANLALSNAVRPGVVGWLKTLARELGPEGVTVNTIAPGRIDTDRLRSLYGADGPPEADLEQIPVRRLGSARGDRRRRRVPRLRPRRLRDGHGDPGRRRPRARRCCEVVDLPLARPLRRRSRSAAVVFLLATLPSERLPLRPERGQARRGQGRRSRARTIRAGREASTTSTSRCGRCAGSSGCSRSCARTARRSCPRTR